MSEHQKPTGIVDLLAALQRSVDAAKAARKVESDATPAPAAHVPDDGGAA